MHLSLDPRKNLRPVQVATIAGVHWQNCAGFCAVCLLNYTFVLFVSLG